MDALPSLPSLTPDNRFWRVDWFGECAYPGGIRRYAQPSILVSLSPLNCDPADQVALKSPDCSDHHHQHDAWPPIAALPLLAIGDIWHEGRRIASPDYQTESLKRLRIAPDTTAFVKSGLAIDEHFLLPLAQHPWHRSHTQSYCVAVTLDEGRRLLVPCIELIRFYFGSSSNLLQRLFTGPLRQETLWASKRLNPANHHLHLVLANRLSGASATDIGRIAESSFAWRAAAGIYASCQKATAQRHPAYPYTGFPFEGTTDLVASGIWLPFSDQSDATFLVYRLRSCSFPFPFRSLSYEASDRKVWRDRNSGSDGKEPNVAHKRSPSADKAADGDPGANKVQRRGTFRDSRQFPDLARKQIWRERIEAAPKPDMFLRRSDGSMEQVAFGDGDGCANAAGMDACEPSTKSSAPDHEAQLPHFVKVALKTIATTTDFDPDAHVVLVRPTGKQEIVFSLPMVVSEEGEIASNLLYSEPDGRTRQRRACFVEIRQGDAVHQLLLIIEGQSRAAAPMVIHAAGPSPMEASSLVLDKAASTCKPTKMPNS